MDERGSQLAVVLATNCTKKFAGALAEAAAKEVNRLAIEQECLNRDKAPVRKIPAAKAKASRKASAMGASACAERDMGGTECPAGNCCRSGMCNRGY